MLLLLLFKCYMQFVIKVLKHIVFASCYFSILIGEINLLELKMCIKIGVQLFV